MGNGPSGRDASLTLNELRFHYRDWGDPQAPPLLLLHGYTCFPRLRWPNG
jgi:pimeloyl-ACP methyl ester carboxylesterase